MEKDKKKRMELVDSVLHSLSEPWHVFEDDNWPSFRVSMSQEDRSNELAVEVLMKLWRLAESDRVKKVEN